ncbi:MAG TPA: YegP family protein [Bacteroidales bacterium]|nr:YegP family protein [Bacteroidales bacterium]
MGKFVIKPAKNGEYFFNLKADNGQTILTSEMYTTKAACQKGVESVRKHSQMDKMFETKKTASGKFHFNLKASNGQVIGSSEQYEAEAGMKNGIESVKKNGSTANIVEE